MTVQDVIDEIIDIGMGRLIKGAYKRYNKIADEVEEDIEFESTAKNEDRLKALMTLADLLQIANTKEASNNIIIVDDIEELPDEAND